MNSFKQSLQAYFQLNESDFEKIAAYFEQETIDKGAYFVRAECPCKKLSFVQDGILRIYNNFDGKEVTQWISTPSNFVTEIASFLFEKPARWDIQALTKTTLLSITRENYQRLNQEIKQWNQIEKAFIANCFAMLEDRVFSHLSMSAEQRYSLFYQKHKSLINDIPQQYIASMLGMTPETLSRIRSKQIHNSRFS